MNILIYHQVHYRTVFLESKAEELQNLGHNVFFLTIGERGSLHKYLEQIGIKAFNNNIPLNNGKSYFKQMKYLIKFCKSNSIDVIFSHLQLANFIALTSRYFQSVQVIPCRHHIDANHLNNSKKSILIDKMISRISKNQVCVSQEAKNWMVKKEGANAKHIIHIPLGYKFEHYGKTSDAVIEDIKNDFPNCSILMIVVSRMVKTKRHDLAFEVIAKAKKEGIEAGLIILGDGPDKQKLESLTNDLNITDNVKFYGYRDDVINFFSAVDLVIHPSIEESSNQVVKEAAICGKPPIVCQGIGDFDDYMVHTKNAFVVKQDNFVNGSLDVLKLLNKDKTILREMGAQLKSTVIEKFEIKKVVQQYLSLVK